MRQGPSRFLIVAATSVMLLATGCTGTGGGLFGLFGDFFGLGGSGGGGLESFGDIVASLSIPGGGDWIDGFNLGGGLDDPLGNIADGAGAAGDGSGTTLTIAHVHNPEPGSIALFGGGLAGLACGRRRFKRRYKAATRQVVAAGPR